VSDLITELQLAMHNAKESNTSTVSELAKLRETDKENAALFNFFTLRILELEHEIKRLKLSYKAALRASKGAQK